MELKDRLIELRTEKGITMDMLVYDMNTKFSISLNKGLVSRWENGINEPSLRYAAYLAQYYDVSLDYLIGLTDVKTPARLLAYSKGIKEIPVLKKSVPAPIPTLEEAHSRYLGYTASRKSTKSADKLIVRRNKVVE